MECTCIEIQKKVLEKLENDPALSSYVKKFGIGQQNTSRTLFPYVSVVSVTEEVEPLCMGPGAPDLHHYRIVVHGGTNSLSPGVARGGNGSGKKGIVHLMDDLVTVLYPGNLEGIFKNTLHLSNASYYPVEKSGGKTWRTKIELRGIRKL